MMRAGLLVGLMLLPLLLPAQSAEERGLAIAREADRRDQGWGDQKAELKMVLRNRQGQESLRELRNKTLEMSGDGDKTLIVFDRPRDVKGTAFLSFTHALEADEQWLYLPALKRVKRISSANKSGPFMGSEFAYEDISSQELEKYRYKWLRDDDYQGRPVFVIERYPQYKKSGYTRQAVWIDQAMYQPWMIEFYDRKDSLLKTLTYHDFSQYLDRYWRPARMEMTNHQNGKSTTLTWEGYQFNNGFSERDFSKNSLKRAR